MRKILLITNHDPLSTGYGAGQRTNLIWKALKSVGKTDVVWLTDSDKHEIDRQDVDESTIYRIETNSKRISDKWWNALTSETITTLVINTINVDDYGIIVSRYITPAAKLNLSNKIPLLIDFDDPEYSIPWKAIRSPTALLKEITKSLNNSLVKFKIKYGRLRKCDFMFVSSRDRKLFEYLKGDLLPNIPHIPFTTTNDTIDSIKRKTIVFIGLMTYRPNIEAVDFFIKHVWPNVLKECPETIFRIIGKVDSNQKNEWLKHPACIVDGFVDDLAAVYSEATLSVSPMLSGGGSNIKVPEACAYECPVVATEYSYGGWSDFLRRDRDILVADNALDFSRKCVLLLNNPDIARTMALDSKQQVNNKLSFSSFCHRIHSSIDRATQAY